MKIFIAQASIFLLATFGHALFAETYYVSKTGNDSNSGSVNAPFSTFSKAVSVMSAGDTCVIRGGVYTEELIVNKNGSESSYLIFKAAEGEKVEIKATSTINGWQQHNGNIYKTSVNMTIDSRFRAVYHNGAYMDLARWPNNVDNNRWTIDCAEVSGGNGSHFLVNNIPNIDWSGGLVYYLGAHSGASWTREITSSSTGRINFTAVDITKWPFNTHNPQTWRNNPGNNRGQLFLFNKLEALDTAREWFYDENSNTLYLQTANGSIPANGSVEYAARKYAAELKGDYIKLEGIEFYGGSVKIHNNADNNQIIGCKITHGNEGHDSLTNTGAQVGEGSLEVLGDNTLIKGCVINHSAVSGINIQGWAAANCTIEGNTISNIDYVGIHASPIRTSGNNMKVLKNRIYNAGRDGMYVAGSNCEVAYNDVSSSQRINSDSGVFYTVGNANLKNNEIHHNWFHDATAPAYSHHPDDPAKAAGIYLDNNSKGYTVHHNVVWNVSWNGYQVNWNNTDLDFYHNTIWNAHNAMDSWVNGYPQSNNKVYNNFANTGTWFTGNGPSEFDIKDSPIFSGSPFVNANSLNFMPQAGSSLVDSAPAIPGFSKTFVGSAADIGAYERGGTAWTAGINAIEDTGVSRAEGDPFFIVNRKTNMKIRPQSDDLNAAIIQVPNDWNGGYVQWEKIPTTDGYFYLRNVSTGDYFRPADDTENAAVNQAATSLAWYYTQWKTVPTDSDYFYLVNRATQQYIRPETDDIYSPILQKPTGYSWHYTQWTFNNVNSSGSKQIVDSKAVVASNVYPNPTAGVVNVDGNVDKITILDISGNILLEQEVQENTSNQVDISRFQNGIYIITVESTTGIETYKLVKQ